MRKEQSDLTVKQAAKVLDRKPDNVRHYIRSGQLPYTRMIGPQYMLDPADVKAFEPPTVGNPNFRKKKTPTAKRNGKKTCGKTKRKRRK